MATRSIQFFMRPAEVSALIWAVASKFGLSVILVRLGQKRSIEIASQPGSILMSDEQPADWVFLSAEQPDLKQVEVNDLRPGELGWLHLDVPREVDNVLLLAQMAGKSDWYDRNTDRVYENSTVLTLFRKVIPFFRKRLKHPVWAYNVLGGKPHAYRNIGYSDGAAEWVRGGGQLLQEGVDNVRFTFSEPQTT